MEIVIYKFTGWQWLFKIPESWCRECDLLVRATEKAMTSAGGNPDSLIILPWFLWFWKPLAHGGFHPPILTINGRIISQGIVPSVEEITSAIRCESTRIGAASSQADLD